MNHMLYTQEISPSQKKKNPTKNQTSCASCEIPTYINHHLVAPRTGGFSAPGFRTRKNGPVVSSSRRFGGPRIEDLILRSRMAMAIGGLEARREKNRNTKKRWCRKTLVIDKIIRHPQVIVIIRHPQVIEDTRWLLTHTCIIYIYICIYKNIPFFGWKIFTYICWTPSDSCFCCVCWMLLCNFQTSCEKACQVWDVSHWFVIGWNMVMKWSTSCF